MPTSLAGFRTIVIASCCAVLGAVGLADAATRTFKPGGPNAFWSNPGNWVEGVAPVDNDDLVFPAHSPSGTPTVNDIPNLHVRSLHVVGQYVLTGQPLFFGEGGFTGEDGASSQLVIDVLGTLDANQSWGGLNIHYNGELRLGGRTLTVDNVGLTIVNGVITGAGTIVKQAWESCGYTARTPTRARRSSTRAR